jgi:hypothetical protein
MERAFAVLVGREGVSSERARQACIKELYPSTASKDLDTARNVCALVERRARRSICAPARVPPCSAGCS